MWNSSLAETIFLMHLHSRCHKHKGDDYRYSFNDRQELHRGCFQTAATYSQTQTYVHFFPRYIDYRTRRAFYNDSKPVWNYESDN